MALATNNDAAVLFNACALQQWTHVRELCRSANKDQLFFTHRKNKQTVLHMACAWNAPVDICRELIEHGLNVEAIDAEGRSCLGLAVCFTPNAELVELLLSMGANVDHHDHITHATPLFDAVQDMNPAVVRVLLAYGTNANASLANGKTPLHLAALRGILKRDPWNDAPEVVELLLEHGADPNAHWGTLTPLHCAALAGAPIAVVELLCEYGANVSEWNCTGGTAYDMAIRGEHNHLIPILTHPPKPIKAQRSRRAGLSLESVMENTNMEQDMMCCISSSFYCTRSPRSVVMRKPSV